VHVDVRPQIELKQYKGLEIEQPSLAVSDEEVDERLEALRREHAVLETAPEDHAIAEDDVAVIDFQGFHNGKAMPQVRNENYSVDIGSGALGEEFEQKLLGLKKGDKTLYEIEFPPEYPNPILAGKTVEFKIDVKEVKVRVKPELDDEFAKDVSEQAETMEALREEVRRELADEKRRAFEGDLDDRIMHRLLEDNPFPVPERLVRYEIEEMIGQVEQRLKNQGLTLEAAGIDREELAAEHRETAEKRVRGDFILKKVSELEDIKLDEEDIEAGYRRIADQYRMSVEEVKQFFQRREEIMPFWNELLNEKILAFLRREARLVAPEGEEPIRLGEAREQEEQESAPAEAAETGGGKQEE